MSDNMTNRQRMQQLLKGEQVDRIPFWLMGFSGRHAIERLMPKELYYYGYAQYPDEDSYGFAPMGKELLDKQISLHKYLDLCAFPVGWGAAAAFGHGGPGEFNCRVIKREKDFFNVEYETGAKKEVRLFPHCTHTYELPIQTIDDMRLLDLPDPADEKRYSGIKEDIAYAKSRGEWTVGYVNGIFSGCHYFFMDYQEFLCALIIEPEKAQDLLKQMAQWSITAARKLCEAGIDCVAFCDDLGSGKSMLISPEMYREQIKPWHKKICDAIHEGGACVHMHSHGAIMPILPDLIEVGVDILNPLDPDDQMPFDEVAKVADGKIVLCGGINKHFFDWEYDEQEQAIKELCKKAREYGKFIFMDPSGIPETVTKEEFERFMQLCKTYFNNNY